MRKKNKLKNVQNMSDKHLMLFLLMNEWVKAKQENKSIEEYLICAGYHSVAVYGMSYAGQRLCDELDNCNVTIKYCIDQRGSGNYKGHNIVPLSEKCEYVDVVIVTPIFYYEEIKNEILKVFPDFSVLSLEEIIYDLTN